MRSGDDEAWRIILTRYRRVVLAVARQHRLGPDDTADVLQATWLQLVRCVGDIRDPACLPGWVRTTAARECLAVLRRQRREAPAPEVGELAVSVPDDVDERLDAERWHGALQCALATLPQRQRALIDALFGWQELSYAQLSARLSMPVGSIGPIRARALRHLRVVLRDEVGVPA
ncbi:sigma-70 family RNA polymerase sigma factor [Kineococcus glutinatus]|uniref:Sigma-70 family RNA polymerase sigma factor n=1 Tax=Kineococcus glutinatus TaxID=1070872 RepID=A0ABP9HGF3_9ACTN